MSRQTIEFNEDLIKKYDTAGPRYTSYPTAVQFNENFTIANYLQSVDQSNVISRSSIQPRPLSLYFHIPFCNTVCFFCGCNKVVTKYRDRAQPYLQRMHREIEMQSTLFDKNRTVTQLHWGGGTPTFISHDEMHALMDVTRKHFQLVDDDSGEYSIEIDPREVSDETLALLRTLGFNRISLGVQDFNPDVQKAVNRIQSEQQTLDVINEARRLGFKSISVDLIYGLPFQTVETFSATLDKIISISPDRVSIFNYAHLPELFKPQRRINQAELPSAQEKLNILNISINKLCAADYVYIGMDHFAKPGDELAIAQREGNLYRNFQGYSTHADCDLVSMGITSIGKVANSYSQNVKTLQDYYARIDNESFPILRGVQLDRDDLIRQKVITELICHFQLDIHNLEHEFGIEFKRYFSDEISRLKAMQADNLLDITNDTIKVYSTGRLLIRNICMVFDKYLHPSSNNRFSKVI